MNIDVYIVFYSVVIIVFFAIMFVLAFSKFNDRVLKKSYLDGKIYIYLVMISAIFYLLTIFLNKNLNVSENIAYLIYAGVFVAYAISIMLTLFVLLRPLKVLEEDSKKLAIGKKNLNIDFEGSIEFDSIAESLKQVQKNYRDNDRKLNKKDVVYQSFFASGYLKYFDNKRIEELEVGDTVQSKVCTMFCDMRNSFFSSETLALQDNFMVVNEFLGLVSKIVKKNGGFVDRFVGDGVIAIFDNENSALKSANQIAKQLDYKNLVSIGKEKIKYGLSLTNGMAVIGVVGNKYQKQLTAIGDSINLCSRIEELNKIFGTRVLMTKTFMSAVGGENSVRYVGTIQFDDMTSKIPIFESLDAYSDATKLEYQKSLQEFETAVRLYEKNEFEKARELFSVCVKKNNGDFLSKLYLTKTLEQLTKIIGYEDITNS